jgi:signal transduction histidine kinase
MPSITIQSEFVNPQFLKNWLLPAGDDDEGFHQECLSLSFRGAAVAGALELLLGLAGLSGALSWPAGTAVAGLGGVILLARSSRTFYEHARPVVAFSLGLGAAVAIAASGVSGRPAEALAIGAVLLLAIPAFVPLLPAQGLGISLAVAAAGAVAGQSFAAILLALASVILAAFLHDQRRTNYRSFMGLLQVSQEFRDMQSKMAQAETSTTMVQLSAALAHELSSPIGTVSSAVDTLVLLSARQAAAPASDQPRLLALQSDLARSLQESMARLKKIVNRIQRLCTLDEASPQTANLNELLREAAALVGPGEGGKVSFEWNLTPLPELRCRPQQLTVVFWNVILNASQAIETTGRISISSCTKDASVEVRIEDNGRGIPPERLARIFDPVFNVAEGRVSTGNWGLFTSRQFIKNHGGDLRIRSLIGQGTTVTLHIPCSS